MFNPINFISSSTSCWYNHWFDSSFVSHTDVCVVHSLDTYGYFLVGAGVAMLSFLFMAYLRADPTCSPSDRETLGWFGAGAIGVSVFVVPLVLLVMLHNLLFIGVVITSIATLILIGRGILKLMEALRRNELESPVKKLFHFFDVNRRLDLRIHKKQVELQQIEAQLLIARSTIPEYREFDDSLTSS